MAPPICSSSSFLFGELIYSADSIPGKVTIINMKQEREKGKENWAHDIVWLIHYRWGRGRWQRPVWLPVRARTCNCQNHEDPLWPAGVGFDHRLCPSSRSSRRGPNNSTPKRTSNVGRTDGRKKRKKKFVNLLNTAEHAIIQIGFFYFFIYLSVVVPGEVVRRLVAGRAGGHKPRRRLLLVLVRHRDASQIDVAAFFDKQLGTAQDRRLRHWWKLQNIKQNGVKLKSIGNFILWGGGGRRRNRPLPPTKFGRNYLAGR